MAKHCQVHVLTEDGFELGMGHAALEAFTGLGGRVRWGGFVVLALPSGLSRFAFERLPLRLRFMTGEEARVEASRTDFEPGPGLRTARIAITGRNGLPSVLRS